MILTSVNEITVWADSLEDQNIDTSCLRQLCLYNYISPNLSFGSFYLYEFYDYHDSGMYLFFGDGVPSNDQSFFDGLSYSILLSDDNSGSGGHFVTY